MTRKILVLLTALIFCGTAQADLFYYKDYLSPEGTDYSNVIRDLGRITEDGSGNFQEGPALMNGLKFNQWFTTIKYKGQNRLLYIDNAQTQSILSIYNTDNFNTPITTCNVSNLSITGGSTAMWGDNVLLAGAFNDGTSGIIEVNPETGEIVKKYTRDNTNYCEVTVCGNKIYAFFYAKNFYDDGVNATDYVEMSDVGSITDELTSFEHLNGEDLEGKIICDHFTALDGKLYADYEISNYTAGVIEAGLLRFDSTVNPSAGHKITSSRKNCWVDNETLSGINNDMVFVEYGSKDIKIYLYDGSVVNDIHTIERESTNSEGSRTIHSIDSMYYDRENGRILFTLYTTYGFNRLLSNKLVVLSKNSDGSFSVSQEIDGISSIIFVDASSEGGSDDDDGNDDQKPNDDDNNNHEQDNPNQSSSSDDGGGGCSTSSGIFMLLVLFSAFKLCRK